MMSNMISGFNGTISDLMIFFDKCFNEDITPNAL